MPTLSQSTAISVEDAGFVRIAPVTLGPVPYQGQGYSPILRGTTSPVANAPVLVDNPSRGLPRTQVASVPPLSDAAFAGNLGSTSITTIVSGSGRSSSGSLGGGSSSSSTTLTSTNTAITTPNLSQGVTFPSSVQLGFTFVLFQLSVSSAARVQLYSSAAAQLADAGRAVAVAPQEGTATGLIADFDLETTRELNWVCSPAVLGANTESPRNPSIYITVTNMAASSVPITVSLFYLPLES